MSKRRAPTKATGGGGYTFADKVAALFLAQMLKQKFPLETDLGSIVGLHFETRDAGHTFDDLLLVLRHGQNETRCAVSVKSNRQLTRSGFNSEFVQDAWEQWRGGERSDFDPERDLSGLIVGVIDEATLHEWRELQSQARSTTPERLSARLVNNGQSSAIQRALFESLRKEPDGDRRDAVETARLVSRLRVLRFSDDQEGDAVNLCAEIVRERTLTEGAKLWSRLLQLASENRGTGGHFDVAKLVRVLRPDFELHDYPDFSRDWDKIASVAEENVKGVRSVIGNGIQLPREDEKRQLRMTVEAHNAVIISGESGSGKSAVVSQLFSDANGFQRIIWLSAEQLSKTSQAELAQACNLSHAIPELISNSSARDCALVVDAVEKLEGNARRRAIELLRAVGDEGFVGWKVILTCQPQSSESAFEALVEAGISDAHKVDFETPKLQEIFDALDTGSGVRALLRRVELQPILRNLMILDWVLRANVAQRLSPSRPWIGETELIDCIWEKWTGSDATSLARDLLLRTLGKREGEKLSGAVHVDSVAPGDLRLLGEFAQEGLVRIKSPAVQFAHDLMGDWARYRTLKFEGDTATITAKTVAHIPRWSSAIRLYAQSLAEHGSSLADWTAASAQLRGEDAESRLTHDLFLDGLLFAANSESLLEQVWAALTAAKGQILHRLLKRLVHVASFPDWRFNGISDPQLAARAEAWFRIPQPLHWLPVLRVLSRHAADVAKLAVMQGAEVCALWLRTMPVGMRGRREAGLLALELAKEAQGLIAEGMHFGDKDKVIYEAALSAAPELPEEVTQIALELCGRRLEPEHAVQRRRDERKREAERQQEWIKNNPEASRKRNATRAMFSSFPIGVLRPQSEDGPSREVSRGFLSAVMDSSALNGLIAVRPMIAKEILLAVCIEEPKHSRPYGADRLLLDRLGLTDWSKGYPAMYWKGPFLRFLQSAPAQALDAIVRLVNYATTRWIEDGLGRKPSEEERRKNGFEFEFGGRPRYLVGNGNVFAWHRFLNMHGDTIACALMALEKWLYEEIEGGRDISQRLEFILEHAESAAFAGLLVTVGLRYPALFTRELQPLLGNFYVYECQTSLAVNEQGEVWTISFNSEPQEAITLAAEWNRMPHRRYLLRDLATMLMFQDDGTMKYLSARKVEWAKLRQSSEKSRLSMEFFLARFDPANYTRTVQADGRVLTTIRWPAHLEEISQRSLEKSNLKKLSLNLAARSRRLLEDQEVLPEEDVGKFAASVQELANWNDSSDEGSKERYRINSIAGGLAVLVVKHRNWLSQNPDIESWCLNELRGLRPVESEDFSPMSISDHEAEVFLGEAGVALLLENSDEWVLRLAFEGVTGAHYNSTLFTLWRAYSLRQELGDRFGELINVMVVWSALRHAAGRESGHYHGTAQLPKYRSTLFRRYARGRLKGAFIPLTRVEVLGRRLVARIERRMMSREERDAREARHKWVRERNQDHKLDRNMPELDLVVIQRGFGFLMAMARRPLGGDKAPLRRHLQELFELEMRTLARPEAKDERSEIEGTPYEFDTWVMARIAEFIAQSNSIDTARAFYRPILGLGPSGKYWVADFLQAWVSSGLPVSPDLRGFAEIWQDMMAFAEALPAWQPGEGNYWGRAESLVVDLMGIGQIGSPVLGDAKYSDLVSSMRPAFEKWGHLWLKHASVAAWFANFLRTESGRVLLPQGIRQLAAVVGTLPDRDWYNHELGALFTDVLSACWKYLQKEVERDSGLRNAFLSILALLCARQVPEALHLRARVSQILGNL